MNRSLVTIILLIAALTGPTLVAGGLTTACSFKTRADTEREAFHTIIPTAERPMIERYVTCINSRFPLDANRWAFVTEAAVAREMEQGNVDLDGLEVTYRSLGCGELR